MVVKELKKCREFISNDGAILRELFNARKGDFKFRYSLAHAIVKRGKFTAPHKLKTTEVYYIIKGKGLMHIDQEISQVKIGSAVYIPPRSVQYIKNIGKNDLEFLCIVDPAWSKEDEKII